MNGRHEHSIPKRRERLVQQRFDGTAAGPLSALAPGGAPSRDLDPPPVPWPKPEVFPSCNIFVDVPHEAGQTPKPGDAYFNHSEAGCKPACLIAPLPVNTSCTGGRRVTT